MDFFNDIYSCSKVWNGGLATKLWEISKNEITEEQAKLKYLETLLENPGYTVYLHGVEPQMVYCLEWDKGEDANKSLIENYVQENRKFYKDLYGIESEIMPKRWYEEWKGGRDLPPNIEERR